jgi:hypothetical protein
VSTIYLTIVVLGLIATAVFVVGFAKGVRDTIIDHRRGAPELDPTDDQPYGASALFAVIASAAVIALAGFSPAFIYAGPLLAIVTAVGVGVAFLVDRPTRGDASSGTRG